MDRDTRIATRNVERDAGRDARLDPDLERDIGLSDEQDGAPLTDDGRRTTDRDPREDVYPAPLAGVEVVGDGPVDLERDEEVVEDAQRLARAERDEGQPTMELAMTSAQLAGLAGLGLLREVRDSDGDIAEIPGSWRPGEAVDDLPTDVATGHTLRFEGPLHRADGTVEHVSSDVSITSVGDYTTNDGERLRLVNFKVSEPGMLAHAAPDDGTLPAG